ncbi:MAG: 2-C-methyl-D-erythritol 4-phosphate cytidylyltransferase, partial [Methylocystis sp.]|nr:2-C-methyl-D-erythritol 4-phosphate cytidylyltransferase [Methylocystis sp.]
MNAPSPLAILVVAGGRGVRAGDGLPKQYRKLLGKTVLARTLDAMHAACPDAQLAVVIHPDDAALYEESLAQLAPPARARLIAPTIGGATRQRSAHNGLEALARLAPPPDIVLIHDAARPFCDAALVARAIAAAGVHQAAVPGAALADTVKQIDAHGKVTATQDRAVLRAVQTPQAFRFDLILAAHRAAAARGQGELTDDAAVAEAAGHSVHVFAGDAA